jgi:hypothetical protein
MAKIINRVKSDISEKNHKSLKGPTWRGSSRDLEAKYQKFDLPNFSKYPHHDIPYQKLRGFSKK